MPCELLLIKLRAWCPVSVFMLYTLRAWCPVSFCSLSWGLDALWVYLCSIRWGLDALVGTTCILHLSSWCCCRCIVVDVELSVLSLMSSCRCYRCCRVVVAVKLSFINELLMKKYVKYQYYLLLLFMWSIVDDDLLLFMLINSLT